MKKQCENYECNITQEDVDEMTYKEKFLWMNILLRIEEKENKMLREHIEKLEKRKTPLKYLYSRLVRYR